MNAYPVKGLEQIKELLPPDCWFCESMNHGMTDGDRALYMEGDINLDHLDLDFSFDGDEVAYSLILVNGDLRAGNISNRETDGAVGLIVLGNLKAGNIVVGGQEIYVAGDLEVNGLYWGDYNHGNLVVNGHIGVNTFLSTDYGFDHQRFSDGRGVDYRHFFWDEAESIFEREVLEPVFHPECLLDDDDLVDAPYSYKDWLNDSEIFYRMKEGLDILLDDGNMPVKNEEVPLVFESLEFNGHNLKRLRESPLFTDAFGAKISGDYQVVEYWKGDDFKRVSVQQHTEGSERVYFQSGDKAVLIRYEKNTSGALQVAVICRYIEEGTETKWYYYDPELPEHEVFGPLTQPMWEKLLVEWSEMEHLRERFRETVTVGEVQAILDLPVIRQKYSDYYNDDAEQLWFGNCNWQFRQADNPGGKCARISAVVPLQYTGDKDCGENGAFGFFHFDLDTGDEGSRINLYTQYTDDYNSAVSAVSWWDTERYGRAIKYFNDLKKRIYALNENWS
ncbi:hypothetical protein [Sinomicrobium soli]|uniref:hypothetical protein n=1 Tax=Sinomicrobium sp. N-1-3-6 TaxID=2219864 RepID=UPI000DCB4A7B|nr:hypothetical protein [Sinomicrobium sp. N-1-3-6]RAV28437.1 hypothetical protein DN748_13725 [Sinomicrobium sp. N-1-3-6]